MCVKEFSIGAESLQVIHLRLSNIQKALVLAIPVLCIDVSWRAHVHAGYDQLESCRQDTAGAYTDHPTAEE
jgi:hypothetical protein